MAGGGVPEERRGRGRTPYRAVIYALFGSCSTLALHKPDSDRTRQAVSGLCSATLVPTFLRLSRNIRWRNPWRWYCSVKPSLNPPCFHRDVKTCSELIHRPQMKHILGHMLLLMLLLRFTLSGKKSREICPYQRIGSRRPSPQKKPSLVLQSFTLLIQ